MLIAGCGDETSRADAPDDGSHVAAAQPSRNLVPAGYDGRFRTSATVLEVSDHGPRHAPQLCHNVLTSRPPQCGGPDIAGSEWAAVEHESVGGTRWGEYMLVGTYDDGVFTLTEEPTKPDWGGGDHSDELQTPCPEPDGGWRPVEPATATDAALDSGV